MTGMTAPAPAPSMPDGAARLLLPVVGVEGIDTADSRHIAPGALDFRPLPLPLYAQTRATHGDTGDAATHLVGAITALKRMPGNQVGRLSTGQYFPPEAQVWVGEAWMYRDVPSEGKSAFELVRDGALRGISMDLSAVTADVEVTFEQDGTESERVVLSAGTIAAATLVGQPAFTDAYVVLADGADPLDATALAASLTPLPVAAGGVPSWRAGELGDACSPCLAEDGETVAAMANLIASNVPAEDDYDPPQPNFSTSGMVALIPANADMLAVDSGTRADELHLTLAFLGDAIDTWTPETRTAVLDAAEQIAAGLRPMTGNVFSHAVFNPNNDNDREPASVYLLDGTEDREGLESLQAQAVSRMGSILGPDWPEQHSPWVPHVTAGYNLPEGSLSYTGRVPFDRLRVDLGDLFMDFPLGGGAMTASAAPSLPPVEIFDNPGFAEYQPLTVDPADTKPWGAYVSGHIARWGTCHTGISGTCRTPPRSPSGYAYYLVHAARAVGADGQPVNIPVGYGTVGTGHAGLDVGAMAAAEHYDNTGTVAFEWNCGEDAHGIWVSGRMLPDLPAGMEMRARGTVMSGDWRPIRGRLEMVAALGVNTPGFPVPRARVASGMPVALVAAGMPSTARPLEALESVVTLFGESMPEAEVRALAALARERALAEQHAQAVSAWDDADPMWGMLQAEAEWTLLEDADHPWFALDPDAPDIAELPGMYSVTAAELCEQLGIEPARFEAFARLSLPPYIKRISKHLQKEGMEQGRAIATAVNAAKRMCSTGDLNFPGKQNVNPGSRAQACAAVAQWKKDRPGAS